LENGSLSQSAIAPDTASKNAYNQLPEAEQDEDGISFSSLAEFLEIDQSYLTKWQQGKLPTNQSSQKNKQAYKQWKQWYLGDDNLWYPR